jgi:hypothetical protein
LHNADAGHRAHARHSGRVIRHCKNPAAKAI